MNEQKSGEKRDYLTLAGCLVLLLAAPLSALAQSGLVPVLPQMTADYDDVPNADVLVRMMVSGLSFAMIIGAFGAGFLAEKLGQRNVMIWSLGLFALFGVAPFWIDNLYFILGSRLGLGVLNALAGVMITAIITTQIRPDAVNKWLGFFTMAGTFGAILMLMLVGFAGSLDWRNIFLIHLLAVPVMIAMMITIPKSEPKPAAQSQTGTDGKAPFPYAFGVMGLVIGAILGGVMPFLPFHLVERGIGSTTDVSTVISGAALGGGISSFAFGWLRNRLNIAQTFYLGFAFNGLGLMGVYLSTSLVMGAGSMVFFGFGVGIVAPNLFSAVSVAIAEDMRARVIGVLRALTYAGPIILQFALEPFVDSQGAGLAIIVLIGLAIAAIALAFALSNRFEPAPANKE